MSFTELRICKLVAEGLRCPDYELVFQDPVTGKMPDISLVMMPNGTGKTTSLNCLRAIFSGEADNWSEQTVRTYRKSSKRDSRDGRYSVEFEYKQGRITVELEFDFFNGSVQYWTNRGSGRQKGHKLPTALKLLATAEFVRLFIFDGEESEKLLDPRHTKADRAVEALFKLHNFEHIASVSEEYLNAETKNASTTTTIRGIKTRTKTLEQYKKALAKLESKSLALEASVSTIKEKIKDKNDLFGKKISENEGLSEQHDLLREDLKRADINASLSRTEALKSLHNPLFAVPAFRKQVELLRDCLDRAKLPENTSREFFEELSHEKECVCGALIDEAKKLAIQERAKLYLGTEDVSVLNQIKSEVTHALSEVRIKDCSDWTDHIDSMTEAYSTRNALKNDVESFKSRVNANDPDLAEAQQEIGRLTYQLKEEEDQLTTLHEHKPFSEKTTADRVTSIHEASQLVKHHERRVQEQLGTVETATRIDLLQKIVRSAHATARGELSLEMTRETNKSISEMMPRNGLRVAEINDCVRLEGKLKGSVGETLCVGYAFLSALFRKASNHCLPLVVDSPAGALDMWARSELGKLMPTLSKQFIGFVISTEKDGFLDALESSSDGSIQYLTLFKKSGDIKADSVLAPKDAWQSPDGFVVEGRDFFDSFQESKSGTKK